MILEWKAIGIFIGLLVFLLIIYANFKREERFKKRLKKRIEKIEWEEIKRGLAIMEERNFLRAYQKAITTEPSITKEEVKMPEYRRIRCE